ncbi:elongation factor P--(R)-beta-lysine ligase [Buchnera aphidicola (Taiwanaphis decaspermi)]|uniref:elongation factor P--(R)-beta-lysine ligase n=1 Tax=Buchnera aphidicola TaxID=9 RepID=UPI0031B895AB
MKNIKKDEFIPKTSHINIFKRAKIINKIRSFFLKNNVLEVDTPIMSSFTVTDVNITPFKTLFLNKKKKKLWLITSPEYHMKRLISYGLGSIYQICHSFRNGELGKYHNPEFTILEWYETNCDIFKLMNKINVLLNNLKKYKKVVFISYERIFMNYLKINPLTCSKKDLIKKIQDVSKDNSLSFKNKNKDSLLEYLFIIGLYPILKKIELIFIYHFPASQASLSKINSLNNKISERFEIFSYGLEIANGFDELVDFKEQKKRFKKNNKTREKNGMKKVKIDKNFINSLKKGLPQCSGVAIGIERLIMSILKIKNINEIINFPLDIC